MILPAAQWPWGWLSH